jgi:hypothetical protein
MQKTKMMIPMMKTDDSKRVNIILTKTISKYF